MCYCQDCNSYIQSQEVELTTLRAENAELRKDAERYRWLADGKRRKWVWNNVLTKEEAALGDSLEEAIDNAMNGE